ncbi:proteasome complex subunit Rpn13 ubiquitin receptor-domain-containing protein [Papiliotrema laurentii]|uniref:Proteasome complex subunit Rpn13 ubiquitin receptor-domain-containing protein n=1 Tax=Papiliotrema laurentii TaxID=5418 RepID=A0AAD9FLI0_PAPLA|nr:proteasome complex subunit Rpn13 ubiquitin receptor-domain-containing protein [Papiliotrema laurentii]
MTTLLSVPAGRSIRRQGTNWVDPQPEKGLLELSYEDDLMHIWWKDRQTGAREDDLIIFPGEATFEKVQQDPTGRTHILKFSSSDQKYFFWFQRGSTAGDLRAQVDINQLIQDPTYRQVQAPGTLPLPDQPSTPQRPAGQDDRSWPPTPGAPRLSHREPIPGPTPPMTGGAALDDPTDPAVRDQMARLLIQYAERGLVPQQETDAHLTDVLSPNNIREVLSSNSDLPGIIASHLPPGLSLPSNPSVDDLVPILSAPQFTDAIASLENALRSGGLPGSVVQELGLPAEAGQSVGQFLAALSNLGRSSGGDARGASGGGPGGDGDETMGE